MGQARGLPPFQISTEWKTEPAIQPYGLSEAPRRTGSWGSLAVPFYAGVMLPHIVVFLAGIALFFLYSPQPEKLKSPEPSVIYVAK